MSYTGFVQGSETTLQSTYCDTSAQPTCDYGYGTWNSGTNRGYENYGYGYGYGQDNTTNYGYGMATSHSWEMASSDTNANPSASGSASADSVLSRINQRLDMMPHLETDMIQGGVYGSGGGERYDSYEACDSRAILSERDLYRSSYDYGELDPEMEMAYEGQYDAYRDQFRMRGGDTFGPRAQGWARDARSGRPMASGYGRMWEDPMGARGQCMPGASRLPSLFSQNIIPEYGMFQGMRGGGAFSGGSRFGFGFGNGMKQMRRTWKTWTTADFRTKKKKRLKVQGACATPASCQEAATVPRRDDSTCGLWQPLGLLLALPTGSLRPGLSVAEPFTPLGRVCLPSGLPHWRLPPPPQTLALAGPSTQPRRRPAPGLFRQS